MSCASTIPVPQDDALGVREGALVCGKFRVGRLIGEGALGQVFEAVHLKLDQRVALKVLKDHVASGEALHRFQREARAAAKLRSVHVARVFDVDVHGERPFIVMEYLEGIDLRHRVRREGRVPLKEAAGIVIQACEALAEAHARGIVHRDIKPANLFAANRGEGRSIIKVLDFGVSKFLEVSTRPSRAPQRALDAAFRTQKIVGSPLYLSPEQIRSSRDVDERTDLWSLGVVLYNLLSGGETPFRGPHFASLVVEILDQPPRELPAGIDVPPALAQVLRKCLAKDPDRRFRTAAELASALAPFADARQLLSVERATALAQSGVRRVEQKPRVDSSAPDPMASTVRVPTGRHAASSVDPASKAEDRDVEASKAAAGSEAVTASGVGRKGLTWLRRGGARLAWLGAAAALAAITPFALLGSSETSASSPRAEAPTTPFVLATPESHGRAVEERVVSRAEPELASPLLAVHHATPSALPKAAAAAASDPALEIRATR